MSNALATVTDPAPRAVASLTGGMVAAIVPQTFDDVYRFAQVVAQSGLCPANMDTPQKVTVAILTGLEIGVKPMQAIQGIAVIGGRPCVWGDLALGVVRGSGELEWIKEFYEGDLDSVDWSAPAQVGKALKIKAVCIVKRKGEPETRNEFSIGDAVVAKLWGKRGYNGKDTPWITNPKRMLKMRARGFGLRDQFTDVLKGLYIAEELIGTEVDQPERVAGPTAPVPATAITPPRPAEPSQPANANAQEAAQGQPVEEGEIVEEASASAAEVAPSPAEGGGDGADQEEPFDPAAWLDEVRDRFQQAKTEQAVDNVHEVYGDTAEGELSLTDRQIYQDMHEAALARTAPKAPVAEAGRLVEGESTNLIAAGQDDDDSVDDGFPGDDAIEKTQDEGQAYLEKIRGMLADSALPYPTVAKWWNDTKVERADLLARELLTKAQRNELLEELGARKEKHAHPEAQAGSSGPSAPPPPAAASTEPPDEIEAYDQWFRARVEACTDGVSIRALSAETLPGRNRFSGTPQFKAWSDLISAKRKQYPAI